MKIIKNTLLLLFALLLLLSAIIYFFVQTLIPEYRGTLKSASVSTAIEIERNRFGVPFIKAANLSDLYFAIGFVHAQERLFQMDLIRRRAQGRLAEIFGRAALDSDLEIRQLFDQSCIQKTAELIPPELKILLNSYASGINFFIEKNSKNLPVEFGLLNYEPEKWEEWHSIAIGRLMSFEFSFGIWFDILNAQIENKLGINYLEFFIPNYKHYNFHTIDSLNSNKYFSKLNIDNYLSVLENITENFNLFGGSVGSNSWVSVTGEDKKSLILANDPHTAISYPARWIQIHITNEDFNVVGLMVPGIPLAIIGRNDNIAFGITSILIDDFDYFTEKLTSDGKYYFLNDTIKEKVEYEIDSIKIKNLETHKYYVRRTKRSIIITDQHLVKYDIDDLEKQNNKNNKFDII